MAEELTLYTNPMSRGQIARWMVHESGIPHDVVILDFDTTMKSDEYLAVNPMGKVPAILHREQVVTECAAICAYLAEAAPERDLAPQAGEHGDYFRWLFFTAGPLEQAVTARAMNCEADAEKSRMVGYGSYDAVMKALDGWLSEHDFVTGGRFTAADVYVGSQVIWGLDFGTLPKLPSFQAYAARLSERAAYKSAKAADNALIAEIQSKGDD